MVESQKTVERFSKIEERVEGDFTNESKKRNKPGVGVVDGKIFVIGGFDGEEHL